MKDMPKTVAELDKQELEYFGSIFVSGLTANRRMCWTPYRLKDRQHLVLDLYTTNEAERIALDAVEKAWIEHGMVSMAVQLAEQRSMLLPCPFCECSCAIIEDTKAEYLLYGIMCKACAYQTAWDINRSELIVLHNRISQLVMNDNVEAQNAQES